MLSQRTLFKKGTKMKENMKNSSHLGFQNKQNNVLHKTDTKINTLTVTNYS